MSIVQTRGGIPHIFRFTIPTAGRHHAFPFISSYIIARNNDVNNDVRMYFTEKDFDDNANYVIIPQIVANSPHGQWAGPVEAKEVWFRAIGDVAAIEFVAFQRRG